MKVVKKDMGLARLTSNLIRILLLLMILLDLAPNSSTAAAEKIRDNLFLLEEAYNQEPGVIQHIQSFRYLVRSEDWEYQFTEEWPVTHEMHQISLTLPLLHNAANDYTGLGDIMINYRYQIYQGQQMYMAPRLSLICPTGDYHNGLGHGMFGGQFNLPVSVDFLNAWSMHLNAGVTVTPAAKSSFSTDQIGVDGRVPETYEKTTVDTALGAAIVWSSSPTLDFFLEAGFYDNEELGDQTSERVSTVMINPSVRWAINTSSGMQIVPGLAGNFTVYPEREYGVVLYLSFEHKLWEPSAPAAK